MDFKGEQAIYLQIADMICDKILQEDWKASERIPSVRELATSFEVNPNTVMRTYNYLQQMEIIFNKRGIGYFLEETAFQKTMDMKRKEFLSKDVPTFVKKMKLLGYKESELTKIFKEA